MKHVSPKRFVTNLATVCNVCTPVGTPEGQPNNMPDQISSAGSGLPLNHLAVHGLVDFTTTVWKCGYRAPCRPTYSLAAINRSVSLLALSVSHVDELQVEFRRRRNAALEACHAAEASARGRAVGTFSSEGQAVLKSGGWCLNMSIGHKVPLPHNQSYQLPKFHSRADAFVTAGLVTLLRPTESDEPEVARALSGEVAWTRSRCTHGASISDFGAGVGSYFCLYRAMWYSDTAERWPACRMPERLHRHPTSSKYSLGSPKPLGINWVHWVSIV